MAAIIFGIWFFGAFWTAIFTALALDDGLIEENTGAIFGIVFWPLTWIRFFFRAGRKWWNS